jgi:O-succinylbenzoic acid--CoA ligase
VTITPPSPLLLPAGGSRARVWSGLERAWRQGRVVALAGPGEERRLRAALEAAARTGALEPFGAALVVGSGGSSGGRRWCLQPLAHLEASAEASGRWLEALGIDPAACLHLDPLPLHHVSGLMPLVRCRRWGAEPAWIPPDLMRRPGRLAALRPLPPERPVLLSLVPTQLQRLLACPEGEAWLRGCAVIWVGGAALPPALAERARRAELRLAPCYGATETAAMVCALPPARFLSGEEGCGPPLADVELRLDPATAAVEVRCGRLSPGWLEAGALRPLQRNAAGWWRSGDAGRWGAAGLRILGRLDGAVCSGAETVFPEQLEHRLRAGAAAADLPLAAVLLLAEADPEWGQRLVALVRPEPGADSALLLDRLARFVAGWPPAERPRRWRICPQLAPSAAGKWERARWRAWLRRDSGPGPGPVQSGRTPAASAEASSQR